MKRSKPARRGKYPTLSRGIALSEIAFPLWLLFKGVNTEQWGKWEENNLRREVATRDSGSTLLAAAGSLDLNLAAASGGAR